MMDLTEVTRDLDYAKGTFHCANSTAAGILRHCRALIDEVSRLTALCDGYRGEVKTLTTALEAAKQEIAAGDAEAADLHQKCIHAYGTAIVSERKAESLESALSRARAEGMEEAVGIIDSVIAKSYGYETTCALIAARDAISRAARGEQ